MPIKFIIKSHTIERVVDGEDAMESARKAMRRVNKAKQAKARRAERKFKALQREAYDWASLGY